MSEHTPSGLSTSRKRSYDGTILPHSQPDAHHINAGNSLPTPPIGTPSLGIAQDRGRQASPAISATMAPTKKQKLTSAELESVRIAKKEGKETREKQKAEDKARREEEKRIKDEEKRRREEEKEVSRRQRELERSEKQKAKDAEKRAKEDQKRKKEEEKEKKERSQMRIVTFFNKPKIPSTPPPRSLDDVSSGASSRRSSIMSLGDTKTRDAPSPGPAVKLTNPDYEKIFPPFFVHPNTELAPLNRLANSKVDPDAATGLLSPSLVDTWNNTAPCTSHGIHDTFKLGSRNKRLSQKPKSIRSIVDQIQGTPHAPVDLTGDKYPLHPESLLDGIPLKVFLFSEDVRPGYCGTYTRPVSPKSRLSLCRQPSSRKLPNTDYDYDSEAEWEPPDEGDDDVDAVDEESGSEEEEDDMEDFLDDEDDVGKRRLIVGNMDPVCSGLCWQGEAKKTFTTSGPFNMNELEMQIISEEHHLPIDPYSTIYFGQNKHVPPLSSQPHLSSNSARLMQPPRLPLHASNKTNIMLSAASATTQDQHSATAYIENEALPPKLLLAQPGSWPPPKPLRLISHDLLPAFRRAVSGSDLNKVGLVEILKKQFPQVSKDVIRDTLSTVAIRQGAKEAEKRWVLIEPL